jgi:hypothetical protein
VLYAIGSSGSAFKLSIPGRLVLTIFHVLVYYFLGFSTLKFVRYAGSTYVQEILLHMIPYSTLEVQRRRPDDGGKEEAEGFPIRLRRTLPGGFHGFDDL